jgi:hypothetical protein
VSPRTIEVDGRRYRRWNQPQRCEVARPVFDGLEPCDRAATHSAMGGPPWPLYLCAQCAEGMRRRRPELTLVAGIYDTASPRRVR